MKALMVKVLAALALFAGMLVLSATPSAAQHIPASVTGTLTIDGTDYPIPGSSESCPTVINVQFHFQQNPPAPPNYYWWVTGTIKVPFEAPAGSGYWFQTTVTFQPPPDPPGPPGPNGGTLIGPGPVYQVQGMLTPQATVETLDDNSCEKGDVICTLVARLIIDPATSTHTGSVPPATGDVAIIEATTETAGGVRPTPIGSCDADIQTRISQKAVQVILMIDW